MTKLLKYEFLLLLASSFYLFMFMIPVSAETLFRLAAAYISYLFLKDIFFRRSEERTESSDRDYGLIGRLQQASHKTRAYLHHPASRASNNDIDVRSYL